MTITIAFLDNDVIHKLVACGLMDDALRVLALSTSDVRIVRSEAHRFCLKPDRYAHGRKKFGATVHAGLCAFVSSVQDVTLPVDDLLFPQLTDVDGIHPGEALLFAAAAHDPSSVILSGDKNAVVALANSGAVSAIAARLAGRILCLAQIFQLLLLRQSFEYVRDHVVPAVAPQTHGSPGGPPESVDRGLGLVFMSNGGPADRQTIDLGLGSHVEDLERRAPRLLYSDG